MATAGGVDGCPGLGRVGDGRRVLDPRVIDADHHIGHGLFHQAEIAEREVAFVQLAVAYESLDHAMDVVPDPFCTTILERPSRRLDGVGDHHDRGFFRPRPRTGVTEVFLPDLEALFQEKT